jgi:DNA-binding response OmpR family regulator
LLTDWEKQRTERRARLKACSRYANGRLVESEKTKVFLEAVIRPGDRICLEGDDQKQADFLAAVLASVEPSSRVGSLELDLIDRTARRGNRQIYLRPREFQFLKYMMQRSDRVLSFANLIKDVWHFKFVPEANRVNVHMGPPACKGRRTKRSPDDSQCPRPRIHSQRGSGPP